MEQRDWVYVMQPKEYGMTCDICGGTNITWSEFDHMIWCFDCEKDTPGISGVFDGPIPIGVAEVLGLSFDRIDLKTGKRLYAEINQEKGKIEWKPKEA